MHPWHEVGDRVFVRRYAFLDQTIGAVLGRERVLVVDTRATTVQARELIGDLRQLTRLPWVVVNTHVHFDHAFGNAAFRPAQKFIRSASDVETFSVTDLFLRAIFSTRASRSSTSASGPSNSTISRASTSSG